MFELVPSQLMRDFYTEKGFVFSDFQKATLIWNAPRNRQEILDALKALAETTTDETLKAQIRERLDFEQKKFVVFLDNQAEKYVYVVRVEDGFRQSFFAEYALAADHALKYMNKYEAECSVEKQLIIKTPEDILTWKSMVGASDLRIRFDYNGWAAAAAYLGLDGEIKRLESSELTEEQEFTNQTDRFEDLFIPVPFDLEIGTPVRDVVSGMYGILANDKEDWEQHLQDIKDGKWDVDFQDIQVMVYQLTQTGIWSHEHINPMYLEIEFPPHIPDDETRSAFQRAMEAFGDYLTYKARGKTLDPKLVYQVRKTAREYTSICREKDFWEKIAKEAETPEELMW